MRIEETALLIGGEVWRKRAVWVALASLVLARRARLIGATATAAAATTTCTGAAAARGGGAARRMLGAHAAGAVVRGRRCDRGGPGGGGGNMQVRGLGSGRGWGYGGGHCLAALGRACGSNGDRRASTEVGGVGEGLAPAPS